MSLKKLASILLSATTVVCMTATAGNAQSTSKVLSGVAFGGSSRATSTLITPDPLYAYYPAYLVNTFKRRFDCGWNLPEIGNGNSVLKDIGGLEKFEFFYEVPNFRPNADSGLVVVIQTDDGFSRAANVTSTKAISQNGYTSYAVDLFPQNFVPAFNTDERIVRTASVRYNGAVGPIYLLAPGIVGQNSDLFWSDFTSKTLPDPRFNNQ
ncbi:MAG: hypothetical protein JST44_20215 [Cyanobacteria bacterium SZAS LIN-5]|nr:hypothetical protein [Cyanobacteria bacterium SZAS LIN-5]